MSPPGTACHSRSLTILEACRRLTVAFNEAEPLIFHIVGADYMEGSSVEETLRTFSLLIDELCKTKCNGLSISLVGVNVASNLDGSVTAQQFPRLHHHDNVKSGVEAKDTSHLGLEVQIDYYQGIYSEFCSEKRWKRPTICFCFNAGVWGYATWPAEIARMTRLSPVVISSYSKEEAEEDEEALNGRDLLWLWGPEENSNRLGRKRKSQSTPEKALIDNHYWQCVKCFQ